MAAVQIRNPLNFVSRYFLHEQPGPEIYHTPVDTGPFLSRYLYSELPNEIIHHILDIAAQLSPECCLALCAVSSWTREWALRYMFPTIIILTDQNILWFRRHPSPLPECRWKSLTHYTRNLWIDDIALMVWSQTSEDEDTQFILERCPNVVNVATNGGGLIHLIESLKGRNNKEDIHLTMLGGLVASDYFPFDNSSPFRRPQFSRLTHINFIGIRKPLTHLDLSPYPNLTHVALMYHEDSLEYLNDLLEPLQRIKTLRMLVVTSTWCTSLFHYGTVVPKSLAETVKEIHEKDNRVYVLEIVQDTPEGIAEWKAEALGVSIWEEALKYSSRIGIL